MVEPSTGRGVGHGVASRRNGTGSGLRCCSSPPLRVKRRVGGAFAATARFKYWTNSRTSKLPQHVHRMNRSGYPYRTKEREPTTKEIVLAFLVGIVVFGLILMFLYYYGTSILAFFLPFILLFVVVVGGVGVVKFVSSYKYVEYDFVNFCIFLSTVIVGIFISAFIAGLAARVAVFAYSNADFIADRSFHGYSWLLNIFSFMSVNNQTNNVST
jgi:hypothetical protein